MIQEVWNLIYKGQLTSVTLQLSVNEAFHKYQWCREKLGQEDSIDPFDRGKIPGSAWVKG